jgi:hypothetical protein
MGLDMLPVCAIAHVGTRARRRALAPKVVTLPSGRLTESVWSHSVSVGSPASFSVPTATA